MSNRDSSAGPARFPTTAWSCIRVVQDRAHPEHEVAVNSFVAAYWKPVFYFVRTRGLPFHEAQDATQDFFLRLMEQEVVARADSQRRFRNFLLGVLKRFLIDWWPRAPAQTRHERHLVSIETLIGDEERTYEPAAGDDPEEVFERRWAADLWQRVLHALREQYAAEGRSSWCDVFLAYHAADGKRPSQESLAAQFGLSRDQVRDVLDKVPKRLERLLRAEVREEVGSEQEVDAEITRLKQLLSSRPHL